MKKTILVDGMLITMMAGAGCECTPAINGRSFDEYDSVEITLKELVNTDWVDEVDPVEVLEDPYLHPEDDYRMQDFRRLEDLSGYFARKGGFGRMTGSFVPVDLATDLWDYLVEVAGESYGMEEVA